MAITAELRKVTEERATLGLEESRALMDRLLGGEATEMEMAALLGAMAARGETAEEIAGFAQAMRGVAVRLPLTDAERDALVDTCGTGGDGSNTFNISTGAGLVAAAAGARVAKHGNRAVTSRCGSADVLEAMGIPIDLAPAAAADALRQHGFCFMLASNHHPGMRAVMPVRRGLAVRTIFNLLGPLLNPAGARRQLMGVYSGNVLWPVAQAMPLLGVQRALVVHGAGGLDELSLSGPSEAVLVECDGGGVHTREQRILPGPLGLRPASLSDLAGDIDAHRNAAILHGIFRGEPGPRRDALLLNAAAVLLVAGLVPDFQAGVQRAAEVIDSGAVRQLVEKLATSRVLVGSRKF